MVRRNPKVPTMAIKARLIITFSIEEGLDVGEVLTQEHLDKELQCWKDGDVGLVEYLEDARTHVSIELVDPSQLGKVPY